MLTEEKIKAVALGHAVGDALGVPAAFIDREQLKKNPVKHMEGHGAYDLPAGCFSASTSMSLATLKSLCCGKIKLRGIMRGFGKWYYDGEFTSTGVVFEVGRTCANSIENRFRRMRPLFLCGGKDEEDNGNGSLMRIYPVALYLSASKVSVEEKLKAIYKVSALTHAHERSKIGCGIYSFILWELIDREDDGNFKDCVRSAIRKASEYFKGEEASRYERLFTVIGQGEYTPQETPQISPLTEAEALGINSSGYIVDTLEAAVFCLMATASYGECVLTAVNLGGDSDTVAAVAGSLAGAAYGLDAIPQNWIKTLKRSGYISDMCSEAFRAWQHID